jgi:hypothetical protein
VPHGYGRSGSPCRQGTFIVLLFSFVSKDYPHYLYCDIDWSLNGQAGQLQELIRAVRQSVLRQCQPTAASTAAVIAAGVTARSGMTETGAPPQPSAALHLDLETVGSHCPFPPDAVPVDSSERLQPQSVPHIGWNSQYPFLTETFGVQLHGEAKDVSPVDVCECSWCPAGTYHLRNCQGVLLDLPKLAKSDKSMSQTMTFAGLVDQLGVRPEST